MKNPCRELRQLLGMNQVDFSRSIGRSYQSLKVYEKHPQDTPPEIVERLISLATEQGHADWALLLKSDDWRVQGVIYPGETLIAAPQPSRVPAPGVDRETLHQELDEVIDSGDPDAIQAVVPNLHLFAKWVRIKRGNRLPAKGTKEKRA